MTPEAKEGGKKKKGKLPIILALLLVLGGGGFFMMKGKGAPKKVEIKAGEVAPLDKEFLVNLAGTPSSFLRAELAFELREGYKKESLDAEMPAVRDCINEILRSRTLDEVSASASDSLRKEIATKVNAILIEHMTPEEKKQQAEVEKSVKGDEDKAKASAAKAAEGKPKPKTTDQQEKPSEETPEKWVSKIGPVLDVYFTSFTTQ